MKILHRYVLQHFLSVFTLALGAFVGLYLIIDFFEKIEDFLQKQVPASTTCLYFLYKTPAILAQGIPVAVLLATLISLGILKRNRELIAMKAAGIDASFYSTPIVLAALAISIVHFTCTETISRTMTQKAQAIWQFHIQGKGHSGTMTLENLWIHGKDTLYQIRLYDPQKESLERATLFQLDSSFKLVQRLDARRIRWNGDRWVCEDGLLIRFEGVETHQEWFQERELVLPETPKDFSGVQSLPEQLDWAGLYRYAKRIRQEGYNAAPYEVELNLRIAFPLTTLVLSLLGITISLRQRLHAGVAAGVLVGLVTAFLYMALLHLGCSMATAGLLPPFVGVWAANVIFASMASYLWLTDSQ